MSTSGCTRRSVSLGSTEDQAQSAVVDLPAPQHLASKEDLLQAIGEVKTEFANLRGDVKAEIAGVKTEIATQFQAV